MFKAGAAYGQTKKDSVMPLYEYECQACHRRLEKIQKFSDAELTVCPHCGGKLERTITAAAFSFAGGGWYKDGYGSTKPAASGGEAAAPAAAADSSASSAASSTANSAANSTAAAAPAAAPAAAASPTPAAKP
jgi:putative FmdB family regulatory protein